uniref:RING-type domain-containing protein n=1 Tax=viral metagenome TaxID=1070528 RepID=A0A6C0AJL5_9ZZZZ
MAEEECILCYEPLDVPVYEQNTTDDIIVGGTSSRLQCGHAYHTICLLKSLQHRSVCPLCNVIGQMNDTNDWWQNGRIQMEGRCLEIMERVKKDKDVREALRECKAARKDVLVLRKEFLKRVKVFKADLRAELGVDEKVKAVMKSKNSAMRIFTRKAKNEGSLTAGAHTLLPVYKVERFLFGKDRLFRWRIRSAFN